MLRRRVLFVFASTLGLVVASTLVPAWGGAAQSTEEGGEQRVAVCHRKKPADEFELKLIDPSDVDDHLGHGDGQPGGPVPGSPGLVFDEGCDPVAPPSVLETVLERGELRCGVSDDIVGFGFEDPPGTFMGFDADMCRVIAAAVLGDASSVDFVPVTAVNRFEALRNNTIDVLIRITTHTLRRDAPFDNGGQGVTFGPTTFYDGQGLLVDTDAVPGIGDGSTLADLPDGTVVCVPLGTPAEPTLLAAAAAAGKSFVVVPLDGIDWFFGVLSGDCEVASADRTFLAGLKAFFAPDAEPLVVLGQVISKEPLAPAVADGDDEWLAIVSWSVFATFYADERGITQANIDARRDESPEVSLAFGAAAAATGAALGLDGDWAYQAVRQVGSYAEIHARNLEPIGLVRTASLNASYLEGGLIYAPPIR